jgi:hypothetical protein
MLGNLCCGAPSSANDRLGKRAIDFIDLVQQLLVLVVRPIFMLKAVANPNFLKRRV